ncbi:hypothetical protein PG993_004511 [Apiospora rasikravindrae]|uniref:MYND-type domain-containing protein n=1 Tax=Apiospora rasikravindrae TaxID=990691 RepID=A0ABR1TD06_9PEZI
MDKETRRKLAVERAQVMEILSDIFKDKLPDLTPDEDPEIRKRCAYCEQPGKNHCARCENALYCSRECQVKDHPLHKALCKTYGNFTDAKRPSESHVRAILFPATETQPKLVWIEQKVAQGKTTIYADKHLGRYRMAFNLTSVNMNLQLIGRETIGHGLVGLSESNCSAPGCLLNKSYMALGEPAHMMPRFGNMVFLATKPDPDPAFQGQNVVLADVDLRDHRHALDNLQLYEMNAAAGPPARLATLTEPVETMPALLLHGDGAFARWNAVLAGPPVPRMQKITTRLALVSKRNDRQAVEQDHAVAARQVGLDWFFRCYAMDSHGWAAADVTPAALRNEAARHLVPRSPTYNLRRNERNGLRIVAGPDGATDYLQRTYPQVGTLMVLERSGAVLEPEHIEVLNLFMDSVAPYNTAAVTDRIDDLDLCVGPGKCGKEEASVAFKKFWDEWKREQAAKGVRVEHLVSPYELKGDVDPGKVMVATMMNKVRRGVEVVDQTAAAEGIEQGQGSYTWRRR